MPSISVAVLGATGRVGQEYIRLLKDHPWFKLAEVTGNTRVGKKLGDCIPDLPSDLSSMEIKKSDPKEIHADLVFSPLPPSTAMQIESDFAREGFAIVTDASPHRMDRDVPLLIPEVNSEHLSLISRSRKRGFIVATPNCTTVGLAMTLKPLDLAYKVNKVVMTSFQALSGAGYPGVPSLDIQGNVIPFIEGEEEKVARETNKILGKFSKEANKIDESSIEIYCSCNRVPVIDGHLESIYLETEEKIDDPIGTFKSFRSIPQELKLPSAPSNPIVVTLEKDRPQPRLDLLQGKGMSIVVGRVRQSKDKRKLQYNLLAHNTIRGASGGAILTAELLCKKSLI
ncbi:MAG: aspartate-semialdehyde dehydrogenase [Nitrososphaerales archaeon]